MTSPADTLVFNPESPEFFENPYPFYRQLREHAPVFRSEQGVWLLSGYDVCAAGMQDTRWAALDDYACVSNGASCPAAEGIVVGPRSFMPVSDLEPAVLDSERPKLKSMVTKALSPKMARRLEPRIRELTNELLDEAASQGEADLVDAVAYPLAITVFCELFGVPAEDREDFKSWVGPICRAVDPQFTLSEQEIAERDRAGEEATAYFRALIAERRKHPKDDLLSELATVEENGHRLSEQELVTACTPILIAGHATTTNLIGNGTLALLRHPDQLELLHRHPVIIASAVEEILRYDSPVQFVVRMASEDIEVGGETIPQGDLAIFLTAAANHDPDAFPEPDRLILTRDDRHHMAFGYGLHFCLGAPLARVEGRVAFSVIANRFPNLRLAGDPVPRQSYGLRGMAKLPIRFR